MGLFQITQGLHPLAKPCARYCFKEIKNKKENVHFPKQFEDFFTFKKHSADKPYNLDKLIKISDTNSQALAHFYFTFIRE